MLIDEIKDSDKILYEFIRGSHCHGIATEKSDIDVGGVFMADMNDLLDLGFNYVEQVSDNRHDETYYELKKFMMLLIKSNPTILEALFVDEEFVHFEHPLFSEIKHYKNEFLTKKCFDSFFRYAESQVEKAKGLHKMINWGEMEKKKPLDFAYTFLKQGSTNIQNWLEYRGLKQQYCGLVNIPNMHNIYGCYYDWGNFFLHENITFEDIEKGYHCIGHVKTADIVARLKEAEKEKDEKKIGLYTKMLKDSHLANMVEFIINLYELHEEVFIDYEMQPLDLENLREWYNAQKPIGYSGLVGDKSQELRLSSVSKGEKPICHISYNKDGYIKHCADFKRWSEWKKNRNPVRYESNLKKSYDAKNMCECFRLIKCGIEIANGEGFKVNRKGIDADFLLDIKGHKFEYEYLISELEKLKNIMAEAMKKSTLKENIDASFVNDLYLSIIKRYHGPYI